MRFRALCVAWRGRWVDRMRVRRGTRRRPCEVRGGARRCPASSSRAPSEFLLLRGGARGRGRSCSNRGSWVRARPHRPPGRWSRAAISGAVLVRHSSRPSGLVAHHRNVRFGRCAHHAVVDEAVERTERQRNFVVVEEVCGVDVEVRHREFALLGLAGDRSPRRITPCRFTTFPVRIERRLRRTGQTSRRQQRNTGVGKPG